MRIQLLILLAALAASTTARPDKKCVVGKIQSKNFPLADLVGVWHKIAHKRPNGDDPVNVRSAVMQLKLIEDDDNQLAMVEYYQIGNVCRGPVTGYWTKNTDNSFHVTFDTDDEGTSPYDADLKLLYQSSHLTIDDEENLVIYECRIIEKDGTCKKENQLATLLSKNRRPNTRELYQSARSLATACIDVLELETLDTLTTCGNHLLPNEEQFLSSAEDTSDKEPAGMSPTKKCLVADVPGYSLSGHRAEALRGLQFHVVAVIDPFMTKQGTSYISYSYEGGTDGDSVVVVYEWTRHGVCYQGYVKETVDPNDSTIYKSETQYLTQSGELKDLAWTAKAVWMRDHMFVTYWCDEERSDGTCLSPRVYVWSSEQEVSQGTMYWMFAKMRSLCIDPKVLTFLNTFSDCLNAVNISASASFAADSVKAQAKSDPAREAQAQEEPDTSCLVANIRGPKTPSLLELLKGVWYFAADINADPKIYIQSAVVRLTDGSAPNTLKVEFYAQKESDRTCVGPGSGIAELIDEEDPTLKVKITVTESALHGSPSSHIEWRSKVLYVDAQHALLYWCYRLKEDGTCAQHDLDILVRTRDLDREDIRTIRPVLDASCVKYNDLRWFDMHTQCGWQMRPARIHRHTYLQLSHKEVLNILTFVQRPRCLRNELKGLNVDLKTFAKSGPWFLIARYDKMRFVTYAMVSKFEYVGRQIAVGRLFETAALPGDSKHCFERTISLSQHVAGDDDTYYHTTLDINEVDAEKATTSKRIALKIRFLFFNSHLAVMYSCLRYEEDGRCASPFLYFLSRHETIDHHELTVLETIAKAVCILPEELAHTSVHEKCLYNDDLSIKAIYPVKNGSCNWNEFVGMPVVLDDLIGVYHEIAVAKKSSWGMASVTSRFEAGTDNKLKTTMHYSMAGQCRTAEGTYELFDEQTNGFRKKTLTNGVETSMATTWYGPFRGDPYFVVLGCSSTSSSTCNGTASLEHGYVAIYSRNRRQDPITLHQTYKWLTSMCIDPAWLQHFNAHTSCGMEIDERTCVLTDVKGTENLDLTKLDGVWYLLAAAFDNTASTRCQVTDGDGENTKRVSCHSQANDGTCLGPGVYDIAVTPDGRYKVTAVVREIVLDVRELTADGFVLYQDDDHFLLYGCGKTNEDGSCVSDEERVFLLSRHASVDRDAVPEGVFTALDRVCVLSSALRYKEEATCGQQQQQNVATAA